MTMGDSTSPVSGRLKADGSMTDQEAERDARDWLLGMSTSDHTVEREQSIRLLTMLARPVLPEKLTSRQIAILVCAFESNAGYVLHARLEETFKALRASLAMPVERFELETHYTTAAHPTRSTFDTAAEALEQAGARLRCHAGVGHVVVRAVKS